MWYFMFFDFAYNAVQITFFELLVKIFGNLYFTSGSKPFYEVHSTEKALCKSQTSNLDMTKIIFRMFFDQGNFDIVGCFPQRGARTHTYTLCVADVINLIYSTSGWNDIR